MTAALALVVIIAIKYCLLIWWKKVNDHRIRDFKAVIDSLCGQYGGEAIAFMETRAWGHSWRGLQHDMALTLTFALIGDSKSQAHVTYVDIAVPENYPLALNVCRHGWLDGNRIARGTMVDVQVGDAEFDAAFRVEGAPADVVAGLFGPVMRAFLLLHPHATLATDENSLSVRLTFSEWHELAESRAALSAMYELGARMAPASQAADAAIAVAKTGNPYRDEYVDEAPRRAARAARIDEVARLRATLARRNTIANVAVSVAGIAIAVAGVIAMYRVLTQ